MTTSSPTIDTPAPVRARSTGLWLRLLLMISVPLAILIGGGWYWMIGGRYVSTDNAYLKRDIVAMGVPVGT